MHNRARLCTDDKSTDFFGKLVSIHSSAAEDDLHPYFNCQGTEQYFAYSNMILLKRSVTFYS